MIHLVTALPCEAKPLIRHYRLHGRQRENGFRIYENERLRLIVAGVGRCAAAAACAYLQGADPGGRHAWLNLGIAGHRELALGEALLAHKITEASSGRHWYPPLPFQPPCATLELITLDQPGSDYHASAAYDMEAAGFYATAAQFSSHELVQVFKVISDNQANPAAQVNAAHAEQIISAHLDTLDTLLQQLSELAAQLARQIPDPQTLQPFLQRWHFSVAQQHQLQRLLQRWQARCGTLPAVEEFAAARSSRQVIAALGERIAAAPLSWS